MNASPIISPSSLDLVYEHLYPVNKNSVENPVIYAMAGIPGSGKSTFVFEAIKSGQLPTDTFILNPDRVMQTLPEYQIDLEEKGQEKAFARWEAPAREQAYKMFAEIAQERQNIIKDMACAREENLIMLQRLKDKGYELQMFFIHCQPEEAISRANARGRFTPESMIYERAAALESLLPHYQILADSFHAYDNTNLETPFKPISL